MEHRTIRRILFLCAATMLAAGCSIDTLELIDPPNDVEIGEPAEFVLAGTFMHFAPEGILSNDVNRDSLFAAVGVSSGWSVRSAKYYIDHGFAEWADGSELLQDISFSSDGGSALDSLMKFYRETHKEAFRGQTKQLATSTSTPDFYIRPAIEAKVHGVHDSVTTIDGSAVDSWHLFQGSADIHLPRASHSDFMFPADTLLKTLDQDSSLFDSIGVTIVPVWVYLELVPTVAGESPICFFAKTGELPDSDLLSDPDTVIADRGEFVVHMVTAYDPSFVGNPKRKRAPAGRLRALIRGNEVRITGSLPDRSNNGILSLYASNGHLLYQSTVYPNSVPGQSAFDELCPLPHSSPQRILVEVKTEQGNMVESFLSLP